MPRIKDPVWTDYECIKTKNSGLWARCRNCSKEMQGILNRLKKHSSICNATQSTLAPGTQPATSSDAKNEQLHPESPQTLTRSQSNKNRIESNLQLTENTEAIIITKDYKEKIDLQIGRYFYATDTAIKNVENEEFIKLCSLLRPGYKPPSANQIGDSILIKVHNESMETKNKFTDETKRNSTFSMSLDGDNFYKCPYVCTTVITASGFSIPIYSAQRI